MSRTHVLQDSFFYSIRCLAPQEDDFDVSRELDEVFAVLDVFASADLKLLKFSRWTDPGSCDFARRVSLFSLRTRAGLIDSPLAGHRPRLQPFSLPFPIECLIYYLELLLKILDFSISKIFFLLWWKGFLKLILILFLLIHFCIFPGILCFFG